MKNDSKCTSRYNVVEQLGVDTDIHARSDADGGIIGSKPYTASANYIHKMSNYCESCKYDRNDKVGENACPFNSLYWDFHDRHREKLQHNHRLSMVYRLWDKMNPELKSAVLQRANDCLENLDHL